MAVEVFSDKIPGGKHQAGKRPSNSYGVLHTLKMRGDYCPLFSDSIRNGLIGKGGRNRRHPVVCSFLSTSSTS